MRCKPKTAQKFCEIPTARVIEREQLSFLRELHTELQTQPFAPDAKLQVSTDSSGDAEWLHCRGRPWGPELTRIC